MLLVLDEVPHAVGGATRSWIRHETHPALLPSTDALMPGHVAQATTGALFTRPTSRVGRDISGILRRPAHQILTLSLPSSVWGTRTERLDYAHPAPNWSLGTAGA